MKMDKISTIEAAKILGVTRVRVQQLIEEKKLPAEKIGRDWFIEKADVEAIKTRPGRGRPSKTEK
jgi:excisionase family DNA binding protein